MSLFRKPLYHLVVLLFLCTACSSQTDNVLRMNVGKEPHALDPRKARDLQSLTITKMFFEGLTRINPQEIAEFALAEQVDVSPDGKTYTFHLRHALRIHLNETRGSPLQKPL